MPYDRIERINEEIKKELSTIIRELKDPRISLMTSVVLTHVTKDLRHAKAFISVLGSKEEQNKTLEALEKASGFIRKEIGHRVNLRYTPEFSFVLDNSIEHGVRISELINKVISSEKGQGNNDA